MTLWRTDLDEQLAAAREVLAGLAAHRGTLEAMAAAVLEALRDGHRVLTCGNGGSAAEAQHLVTELLGRFRAERAPLPALFLGHDAAALTCIGNDHSFDEIFSRPLQAHGKPGDILFCFTTSGEPRNLLRALETSARLGIGSVAFLGRDGGAARGRATYEIIVASDDTARVQEAHLFLLHWLCSRIDEAFAS